MVEMESEKICRFCGYPLSEHIPAGELGYSSPPAPRLLCPDTEPEEELRWLGEEVER